MAPNDWFSGACFRPLRLGDHCGLIPKEHRKFSWWSLQWLSQRLCLRFLLFLLSPLHYHFLLEDSLIDLFLNSQSKQKQRKRNRAHRPNLKGKHHQLQPRPLKFFPRNRFTRVCSLTSVSNVKSNNRFLNFCLWLMRKQ